MTRPLPLSTWIAHDLCDLTQQPPAPGPSALGPHNSDEAWFLQPSWRAGSHSPASGRRARGCRAGVTLCTQGPPLWGGDILSCFQCSVRVTGEGTPGAARALQAPEGAVD